MKIIQLENETSIQNVLTHVHVHTKTFVDGTPLRLL